MAESAIARRYARALLELAQEADVVDRVGDDLRRFQELVAAHGGLIRRVLVHPAVGASERRALLDAVLARLDTHPLAANTLRLMQERRRLGALEAFVRTYQDLADRAMGRARAVLTTARPVSAGLVDQVTDLLSDVLHRDVVLATQTDPALIGGLVIEVEGRVWDASVRTRLEQMRRDLLARPANAFQEDAGQA